MDHGFGWGILVVVLAWLSYQIYQGFKAESAPPLTMADNGHGLKEPICSACQARLVTITRDVRGTLGGLVAGVFILGGLVALVLVNWLAGLVAMLLGVVIYAASKRRETVLHCPSCRTDVRRLA